MVILISKVKNDFRERSLTPALQAGKEKNMSNIMDWQKRLGPILHPLAAGYARLMARRAEAYTARGFGFIGPLAKHFAGHTPGVPCISVGNISWGGTGKTPLTRWLGQWFIDRGHKPVVLTRGYGGRPARLPMAVNPYSLPEEVGDEALMLTRFGIPVVVDPKRARSAAWVEARFAPDVLLMDDGFQHLALARDLDLVVMTPHDLTEGWGRVLPAGAWREGPQALARASAFMVNADPETFDALERDIAMTLLRLEKPVFAFHLQGAALRFAGEYAALPKPWAEMAVTPEMELVSGSARGREINGAPYALVSGVGRPERVTATATAFLGYPPAQEVRFGDHHAYKPADVAKLAALWEKGLEIVCTAKDAVKLADMAAFPLWVLEVEPVFHESIDGRAWEDWLQETWADLQARWGKGTIRA